MRPEPTVSVETRHRVLRIRLNRPEKRNALNAEMCSAIIDAVKDSQQDDAVGAILISGNGHVFCAGMDFEEAATYDREKLTNVHEELFSIGKWSTKPIVVCVNGAALGGGLGLAVQGHVLVASTGAAFGLPEIKIGLWPLMVYRSVEEALGARRTLELSLTGRLFHAGDALAWGLVSSVCHAEEVFDRAKGLANDLAKASPKAIEAGMTYLRRCWDKPSGEAGQVARELRNQLMDTADFREGIAAFKEKREPSWPSSSR